MPLNVLVDALNDSHDGKAAPLSSFASYVKASPASTSLKTVSLNVKSNSGI